MKQIIDNLKQSITPKSILWAYSVAFKLQRYHYSLALKWAVECLQIYSSEFNPDQLSKLNKYIQQAMEKPKVLTSLQCDDLGREIWYLPGREEIQTATARLYWSIASFKDEDERGGVMQATMAVELVLPDPSNSRLLNRYLKSAAKIHEEYESQNCAK